MFRFSLSLALHLRIYLAIKDYKMGYSIIFFHLLAGILSVSIFYCQ